MARSRVTPASPSDPPEGVGFLLAKLGAAVSAEYAERLKPLGFKPTHVGILRVIEHSDGLSQQAIGEQLGIFPSRLVGLIDELQTLGLLERRSRPTDRRSHALHLTDVGRAAWQAIHRVSIAYQDEVCAPLDDAEREQLVTLLKRVAAGQGLRPGAHPALSKPESEGG